MSYRVFLSYSRQDREFVEAIAALMRTTGAPIFRDKDCIPLGTQWRPVIAEAIANADATVVFWSHHSAQSPAVQAEYRQALALKKTLVPVLLDSTPMAADLSEFNGVDFRRFLSSGAGIDVEAGIDLGTSCSGLFIDRFAGAAYVLMHELYTLSQVKQTPRAADASDTT